MSRAQSSVSKVIFLEGGVEEGDNHQKMGSWEEGNVSFRSAESRSGVQMDWESAAILSLP